MALTFDDLKMVCEQDASDFILSDIGRTTTKAVVQCKRCCNHLKQAKAVMNVLINRSTQRPLNKPVNLI